MTRVALDLLGGDHAPGSVVDGALRVAVQAAREGLVPQIAGALSDLLDRTREPVAT